MQGSLDLKQYLVRLAGIFAFFLAIVGGPIAYETFNPSDQPVEWLLSATVGSLVVVAIVVVRIFLGWAYGKAILSHGQMARIQTLVTCHCARYHHLCCFTCSQRQVAQRHLPL